MTDAVRPQDRPVGAAYPRPKGGTAPSSTGSCASNHRETAQTLRQRGVLFEETTPRELPALEVCHRAFWTALSPEIEETAANSDALVAAVDKLYERGKDTNQGETAFDIELFNALALYLGDMVETVQTIESSETPSIIVLKSQWEVGGVTYAVGFSRQVTTEMLRIPQDFGCTKSSRHDHSCVLLRKETGQIHFEVAEASATVELKTFDTTCKLRRSEPRPQNTNYPKLESRDGAVAQTVAYCLSDVWTCLARRGMRNDNEIPKQVRFGVLACRLLSKPTRAAAGTEANLPQKKRKRVSDEGAPGALDDALIKNTSGEASQAAIKLHGSSKQSVHLFPTTTGGEERKEAAGTEGTKREANLRPKKREKMSYERASGALDDALIKNASGEASQAAIKSHGSSEQSGHLLKTPTGGEERKEAAGTEGTKEEDSLPQKKEAQLSREGTQMALDDASIKNASGEASQAAIKLHGSSKQSVHLFPTTTGGEERKEAAGTEGTKEEVSLPLNKEQEMTRWALGHLSIPEACGGGFEFEIDAYGSFETSGQNVAAAYLSVMTEGLKLVKSLHPSNGAAAPYALSGRCLMFGRVKLKSFQYSASPFTKADNTEQGALVVNQGEFWKGTIPAEVFNDMTRQSPWKCCFASKEASAVAGPLLIKVSSRPVYNSLIDPKDAFSAINRIGVNIPAIKNVLLAVWHWEQGLVTVMKDLQHIGYSDLRPKVIMDNKENGKHANSLGVFYGVRHKSVASPC